MFRNHAVVYTKSEFILFIQRKPRDSRVVGKRLIDYGKSSDCSRVDLSAEISQTEDLSMKNNTYMTIYCLMSWQCDFHIFYIVHSLRFCCYHVCRICNTMKACEIRKI